MRNKIFSLLLCLVLVASSAFAETVIVLHEVVEIGFIGGDAPLDSPDVEGDTPPRPRDFHATIDGNNLSITKQEANIPFAQAIVVKASTGGVVLNQQFTSSLQEQISNAGVYVLRINGTPYSKSFFKR